MIIAILGLSLGLAAIDPCDPAPEPCRRAARDAILTWRTEAERCEIALGACLDRLAVRTASSAAALAAVDDPPAPPSDSGLLAVALVGTAVAVLAFFGGVFAGWELGRR